MVLLPEVYAVAILVAALEISILDEGIDLPDGPTNIASETNARETKARMSNTREAFMISRFASRVVEIKPYWPLKEQVGVIYEGSDHLLERVTR